MKKRSKNIRSEMNEEKRKKSIKKREINEWMKKQEL